MFPYMSPFKRSFYKEVWKRCEQIIDQQMYKYKAKDGTLGNYEYSVLSLW